MQAFGPDAQLTSIVNNWGPYYVDRIQAVINGTWESQDAFQGIPEYMVEFSRYGKGVPRDIRKLADRTVSDLRYGKIHPFTGPLKKQNGKRWLGEGEVISTDDLRGMNFYVEGIEGSLPK